MVRKVRRGVAHRRRGRGKLPNQRGVALRRGARPRGGVAEGGGVRAWLFELNEA